MRVQPSFSRRQHGAVLIFLVLFLVMLFSTALLTGMSPFRGGVAEAERSLVGLARAKSAVIAYAQLSDPDKTTTGLQQRYLPCPDVDGDGIEETPCGTLATEGWLPWRTLGLPPITDAAGSCLRYYVSAAYKKGAPPPLVSALPPAEFSVTRPGELPFTSDVVAMVFASNSPLSGQQRANTSGVVTQCGSTSAASPINLIANHLDSIAGISNTSAPNFVVAPEQKSATTNFNDMAVWIVRTDLL